MKEITDSQEQKIHACSLYFFNIQATDNEDFVSFLEKQYLSLWLKQFPDFSKILEDKYYFYSENNDLSLVSHLESLSRVESIALKSLLVSDNGVIQPKSRI